MSRSPLPSEFGETPTKVTFEGFGDHQLAEQLYLRLAGEISSFQQKARQNRQISGQPSSSMQQALPDGGQLRYQWNGGMETIFVRLSAERVEELRKQPPPPEPDRADPVLAIDVLFDAHLFAAGDVWAFTETTTYVPGTPGVPEHTDPDRTVFSEDISYWTDGYPPGAVESIEGGTTLYLDAPTFLVQYPADLPGRGPVGTHIEQTFVFVKFVDDGFHDYGFGIGGTGAFTTLIVEKGGFHPAVPPTPGHTVTTRHDTRDQRRFFDVLDVAGAIGNPDPKGPNEHPYTAKSVSLTSDDDRLIPAQKLKPLAAISRELVVSDTAPPGFVGAGFLAQPTNPQVRGASATTTVIDVYIGSSNVSQVNTKPTALTGSKFNIDDSSMTYDATNTLSGRVRVREFADVAPMAVKVTVTAEMEQTLTPGGGGEGGGPGLGTTLPQDPPRPAIWYFAAAPTWADSGNEPAKPDAKDAKGRPTMGELLAEIEFPMHVAAKVDPIARKFYTAAEWPGDVDTMTKVCRIEWTPADHPHVKGKATIS